MKEWVLERWNDPAKFVSTLRSLVAIAAVVVTHFSGAPGWLVALIPAIALGFNAGDKNTYQPETKVVIDKGPPPETVTIPGHEVPPQ